MTNTSSTAKKPVYRKQLPGGISAAVFENDREGRTYRSVNLQRSYYKNSSWQRMSLYLDHQDIPFAQEALKAVWDYLNGDLSSLAVAESAADFDPVDETILQVESNAA